MRLLLAGVLMVGWLGHAQASLVGSTVNARFLLPDTSTVLEDEGTTVIANGTEISFLSGSLSAVFSPNQIVITNNTPGGFADYEFNGIDLLFASGTPIAAVAEDASSSTAFAAGSILSFTASDIRLNLANTCATCVGGESIVLNVVTRAAAAVPEPASMALLGFGAAGIVAARRPRRWGGFA